ncbi:MAG TPA: sulfate adenylyltransferase, partial [Bacteroidetes bacterium]|nr:sulfate adenylyltransferase [Bacteroidota bacterium]
MILAGLLTVFTVSSALEISDELLATINKKYGEQAVTRIEQWQKLMKTGRNLSEQEKLRQVNDFFNQRIDFVDDVYL